MDRPVDHADQGYQYTSFVPHFCSIFLSSCSYRHQAVAAISSASAQQQTMRVRGTIEKLDGNVLVVKSRNGAGLNVRLTDNGQVVGVEKAALSDITVGSYVGSATKKPDGTLDNPWKFTG